MEIIEKNGFGLTEEEVLLRDGMRKYCQENIEPRFMEGMSPDTLWNFEHEFLAKLGDLDYLRVSVAEEMGGLGQRLMTRLITTEEAARVDGALGIHVLEQATFGEFMAMAVPAAWEKYGEEVLSGRKVLSAAFNAPEGQVNFTEQKDLGVLDGDEWVLNGEKCFSSGATFADVILVLGLCGGDAHVWVVEPGNTPGMVLTAEPEIGNAPEYGTLSFTDVRIPKEYGGIALGMVQNRKTMVPLEFKSFSLGCAALAMGTMSAAYEKTVAYLMQRTTDFQPILSLGSIQYKMAMMKGKMEAARSLLRTACELYELRDPEAPLFIDLAKQVVCDTARYITDECVQMHGCVGINPKSGIARHHTDAMGFSIGVCTSDMHLSAVATEMGFPGATF